MKKEVWSQEERKKMKDSKEETKIIVLIFIATFLFALALMVFR